MGADPIGPCWWEDCDAAGTEVIRGVPVAAAAKGDVAVAAAAERITRLGLVVCTDHVELARAASGGAR